jgi:hypothetical protein
MADDLEQPRPRIRPTRLRPLCCRSIRGTPLLRPTCQGRNAPNGLTVSLRWRLI